MAKRKVVALVSVLVFLLALSSTFGFLAWKHGKEQGTKERVIIHESSAPSPALETASPSTKPEVTETEVSLSANEQYEANIFLSNFAETNMESFTPQTASVNELVNFAFGHNYFNGNSAGYESSNGHYFRTLPLDKVNAILDRFFGRTLSQSEAQQYSGEGPLSEDFYYASGKFYIPAADGATIGSVVIVDHLYKRSDGTYRAEFTMYSPRGYDSVSSGSREVYSMTPAQAASSSFFDGVIGQGTAVMTPYEYKGRHSYHLVSYSEFE